MDGPDQEFPTREEVARYLRMEVSTLKRLIAAGEFPEPFPLSPGVLVWTREEVHAWAVLRAIRSRFRAAEPKRRARDSSGQPRESEGQSGATGRPDRPDS